MKIALFDKDKTLVVSNQENGLIREPGQQLIKPGSLEIVKSYYEAGYELVVVSNQGGVEYNHKTLETAIDEMMYCNNLFVQELKVPVFSEFYFCPDMAGEHCYSCEPWGYSPEEQFWRQPPFDLAKSYAATNANADGRFRKPNSGMLDVAIRFLIGGTEYEKDPNFRANNVVMIGDRQEDETAANKAGVRFIHIDQATPI